MISFLIESSIGLALLYGFYHFFLRKGKDFRSQRFALIFIGIISIVLPLLNIQLHSDTILTTKQFLLFQEGYSDLTAQIENEMQAVHTSLNLALIVLSTYIAGVLFFLSRLVYFIIKPFKFIRKYGIKKKGKFKLVYSDNIPSPFSILNFIFLNQTQSPGLHIDEVIAHEKVHVSQRHTLDLIFIELILVFQWFNPFTFLLKRSLQEVHEYLADEGVLKQGVDPFLYIRTILNQVSRKPAMGLVSQFNSITKKRIVMITNHNLKKKFKLSYLFMLPIIALLFMAFSLEKPQQIAENSQAFMPFTSMYLDFPGPQDADIPSIWPVDKDKCKFTSGYGERIHPILKEKKMHNGIDLAAKKGTPVKVTANGIIEKTEDWPEGYGKYIVIKHNETFVTLYAQLSEIKVKSGDRVKKGDVIGLVGESGWSTGPHLHYEVRKDGEPVDPADYLDLKRIILSNPLK